jgi:hypothetical protein
MVSVNTSNTLNIAILIVGELLMNKAITSDDFKKKELNGNDIKVWDEYNIGVVNHSSPHRRHLLHPLNFP